jgi:hypothetical protein
MFSPLWPAAPLGFAGYTELSRVLMQNLVEVISTYVRETQRLESLPSSTETTFYADLKALLNAVLKSERLPFDVITGTSDGGAHRHDMRTLLGDSALFVGAR